jgi:hypothetical protein
MKMLADTNLTLQAAFPGSTGYSPRNLCSAKQLYLAYCDPAIWLQPVAKLAKQPGDTQIRRQPVAKLTPETVQLADVVRGEMEVRDDRSSS